MKGQHLVIGLVVFVILIVIALYIAMSATFKKDVNPTETIEKSAEMKIEKKSTQIIL